MNHKASSKIMQGTVIAIAGGLLIALLFFIFAPTQPGKAISATTFNPGRIMDDNVMTNKSSMNTSQIQSFLNSKVPSCDTNGSQPASDFGRPDITRAQYASSRGWPGPPYTCLKDYSENGKTSARIIYDTAQEFSINPQVLIVLLQKEQGLVTDIWPLSTQYRTATGYGCPDTAPCDSEYYGFTNQIRWAARMFRAIMNAAPTWYTPYILGNNHIQYHPNSSCGGTTINIQNRATQALYNYTPYQPNSASLNAGYGTGNSCSSYGNRNFYLYFSDWFGSTYGEDYAWREVSKKIFTNDSKTSTVHENALKRSQSYYVQIKAMNIGNETWKRNVAKKQVNVGTWKSMDRRSAFCNADWMGNSCDRAGKQIESEVAYGETGTFEFWITAPSKLGTYSEYFNLVMDGSSWLRDIGFYWRFTVSDKTPSVSDRLLSGQSLRRGEFIRSKDGRNVLLLEKDGRLRLFNKLVQVWNPARNGVKLVLQNDGNLVLYNSSNSAIWSSGTSGANRLVLQNDGNLVLYNSSNSAIWSSGTAYSGSSHPRSLADKAILFRDQEIKSPNGEYTLALQKDGNLVLYSPSGATWATDTSDGYLLAQQEDGNLVLYTSMGRAIWSSGIINKPGSTTYLQNDGNFVTYDASDKPIWASNTAK